MIKLGEAKLTIVTSEDVVNSNETSDFPVEDKTVITENTQANPVEISIGGMCKGEDAFETLKLLRKYTDTGEIINYSGRNTLSNCIIQSLSTNHGADIKSGFKFNIGIKQVFVAQLQESNIDFNIINPQQVNSVKNLGKTNVKEIKESEEPYVPFGTPSYRELGDFIQEKLELQISPQITKKWREVDKFYTDKRTKINQAAWNEMAAGIAPGVR